MEASIERHGGAHFEDSRIRFDFRGDLFEVTWDGGAFEYRRTYLDEDGRTVVDVMDNEGTRREVDGTPEPLDDQARGSLELTVNSTIYFAFLPFRLQDPAVRLRRLEPATVAGDPYEKIEVTFAEAGGGEDWEDRFVYWFHANDHTLDYMAYRYFRGDGGTRFRRAVNRREVGGLLLQDYENYTADPAIDDIAEYDRFLEANDLELVSMVEIADVHVERIDGTGADSEIADEEPAAGLEVQLGIDRHSYSPGSDLRAVLRVVNRSGSPVTLEFPSAQRYDLLIVGGDGEEVIRWSAERAFAQVLGEETLEPGETLEYEETLSVPDRPASYELQGMITAPEADLWAQLPFEVADP